MKNYILTLALSLVIISCEEQNDSISDNKLSKVELTKEEFISIAYDNPKELTEYQIVEIVDKFTSNNINRKTRVGGLENIKVGEKSYISNKENISSIQGKCSYNIPVYSVIVGNGNFKDVALVSGDERVPFIIAYYSLDKDREEAFRQNGLNNDLMLDLSKNQIFQELENIENIQDSLRQSTLKKVSEKLNIEIEDVKIENIKNKLVVPDNKISTRADMITNPNNILGTVIGEFGPWCRVKWDVGMPYNRTMPQACPDNWLWDNRYAISSVVVAVAQTLAYFQPNMVVYGESIDWNYLKVNEEIFEDSDYFGSYVQDPLKRRNMVANLMKYIGEQCSVQYHCGGASVDFTNVSNFLQRYGIKIDGRQTFNTSSMISYIENLSPIIMYGQTSTNGGHWWLIDGLLAVIVDVSGRQEIRKYIHANMGMGKSYTGYYYATSNMTFNPSFAHFSKNLVMYPNVRRN